LEGPGVWPTLGEKKNKKDWSLANSGKKKKKKKEKKEYIHTHSYTHVVVHTSMYDGEEA